jgi:hypothetical protein
MLALLRWNPSRVWRSEITNPEISILRFMFYCDLDFGNFKSSAFFLGKQISSRVVCFLAVRWLMAEAVFCVRPGLGPEVKSTLPLSLSLD